MPAHREAVEIAVHLHALHWGLHVRRLAIRVLDAWLADVWGLVYARVN